MRPGGPNQMVDRLYQQLRFSGMAKLVSVKLVYEWLMFEWETPATGMERCRTDLIKSGLKRRKAAQPWILSVFDSYFDPRGHHALPTTSWDLWKA